jgi:hypothetical protein
VITEQDIQTQLTEAREREKGKHLKQCPFCADGTFLGKPCECCNGTATVDHLGLFMAGFEMRVRYEVKILNAFFALDEADTPMEVAAK